VQLSRVRAGQHVFQVILDHMNCGGASATHAVSGEARLRADLNKINPASCENGSNQRQR
jgi:hypothetical protein